MSGCFFHIFHYEELEPFEDFLFFRTIETIQAIDGISPGSKFSTATVNLKQGIVDFENVNESLEDDIPVVVARYSLWVELAEKLPIIAGSLEKV